MPTTVTPSTFSMVDFDADVIRDLVDEVAAAIGLAPEVVIEIEVDETVPLGRNRLESVEPVRIWLESGALEDPKRLRQFSPTGAKDVLGRHLLRASDRLDPDFGEPSGDTDLALAHRTAWDVYAVGRLARAGYPANRQRWRYAFRNRHGFTDVADAAFDALWDASELTWAQIEGLSDEVSTANPGRLDRRSA